MKISIRALKSITLLPGSPILKVDGPPRFASTVIRSHGVLTPLAVKALGLKVPA
jgi:hypothetical protein